MRRKSLHPENSKTALNKKMYTVFENSLLAREDMNFSTYINDISKRVKVLTLRKIERKTELSGISQCTRAILKSLSNKDGVTEMELCRDIKYAAATVSVALKKMSYDKILDIRIDAVDRRQTIIFITDKGREICEYLDKAYEEIDEIILQDITPEEQEMMMPVLKKMLVNVLEAQGRDEPSKHKKKSVRVMNAKELMERNNQQIVPPKSKNKQPAKAQQKESEPAAPAEEENIENAAPVLEEATAPVVQAPKRGRGRPRKQKPEEAPKNENNES